MRVKEIIKYVVNDNIVIDREIASGDWINVYRGACYDIPVSLLDREVQLIAPLNNNTIEITIL